VAALDPSDQYGGYYGFYTFVLPGDRERALALLVGHLT
jgi:hypothetical protein